MPWKAPTVSELRFALVHAVRSAGVPAARAARDFGVSRKTAFKWLRVYDDDAAAGPAAPDPAAAPGPAALADRSRRPHRSPARTPDATEAAVVAVRDRHNWGPRKIHHYLAQQADRDGRPPPDRLPSPRTCAAILGRHGRVGPRPPAPPDPAAVQRFERDRPNALWQVDFKGPVEVARRDCMPLAVVDDHSRYLLAYRPCGDCAMATAWAVLWDVFGDVGLPDQVLADNGFRARQGIAAGGPTPGLGWFDARLVRLGIGPCHGRPYHPQTQGKVERLNGTSDRELNGFDARRDDAGHYAADCERWRVAYNTVRPHEAIGDVPPVARWRPSDRPRPKDLPDAASFYPAGAETRTVSTSGDVRVDRYRILCGRGITGQAVRIDRRDREIAVFYCQKEIRNLSHDQLRLGTML
jgi:transposase InsO family protein